MVDFCYRMVNGRTSGRPFLGELFPDLSGICLQHTLEKKGANVYARNLRKVGTSWKKIGSHQLGQKKRGCSFKASSFLKRSDVVPFTESYNN
jgi:hypothetical protein